MKKHIHESIKSQNNRKCCTVLQLIVMFTMQTIGTNFLLVLTGKVIQNSRKISKVKISEQKIINSKTILLSLSAVSSILLINAQEKPFKVSKNATFLLCQWLSFSWMHV
jgi:hypothetical protein